MEFEQFKLKLFNDLKKKSKKCLRRIDINKNLVQANLGENADPNTIDMFVKDFNKIILVTTSKFSFFEKYSLYEEVLRHNEFSKVYSAFKNSDILINACKYNNKTTDLIKWLLTMEINPCVQNEEGLTALMIASKKPGLINIVKEHSKNCDCINLLDNNKKNALFYALDNKEALNILLQSNIDTNIIKEDGKNEPILMYCCKNDIFGPIPELVKSPNINANIINEEGWTPAMYLAEKGRTNEFISLKKYCNYDTVNSKYESVLSIIIQKIMNHTINDTIFPYYVRILSFLVHCDGNFNVPVDNIENTALMAFMVMNDTYSVYYILKYNRKVDLRVKNKYGENASSLCLKCNFSKTLLDLFFNHPTFDFDYVDNNTKNTMLMLCSMTPHSYYISNIINKNVNIVNEVNNRQESALILATKFKNLSTVDKLFKSNIKVNQEDFSIKINASVINVNQKDYLGNTALYYAVDLKDTKLISYLVLNHADINIKNNEGQSPLDYAYELDDKAIITALLSPTQPTISYDFENSNNGYEASTSYSNSFSDLNPPNYSDLFYNDSKTKHDEPNDPSIKYKETYEYLYPYINNNYRKMKTNYQIECQMKSIYSGAFKFNVYETQQQQQQEIQQEQQQYQSDKKRKQ